MELQLEIMIYQFKFETNDPPNAPHKPNHPQKRSGFVV
jgi:hypothetical protein